MEELYFNDIKIELPENTISQTKQVNDIGDVKDRQSNYSNNIKIPKTDKNVATFEMLGIAGNVTVIPYNEIKIKYTIDGIELISNGTGIVKNTNDYYNLVIYDGNINLSDTIGSKQLRTLDWSSYNHQLTNATYVSGVNKTSGYIYSFADFYDGLGNINIDRQIPSLFVHTIWNEIFTQNGLTYSGNIFTDADFKSRIFTPSKGYDTTIVSGANVNQSTNIGNGNINYVDSVPTQHIDVVKSGTFTDSGDYVLNLIGTINRDAADLVTITVKANNVVVFTKVLYNTSGINESTFNESLSLSQGNGDTYSVEILTASEEFPHDYRVFLNWNITTLSIDILPKYVNIDFATMFSDETQLAFVKDIMQHFGILFKRQRNTDNYEFTTIKELLNDTLNADDWSDKYSSVTNESYKSGYAQINYGKYIYDDLNTNIEQTFADGQIDVSDVNIQATKTLFTSIFKASNFADGSLQYFKCKAWELDDEEIIQPLENGLRLFKKTEELKTISYGWSDSLSKITDTITVSYLDFTDQDYQSEFDNYYSEFNAVLNNYKKITINCNLSLIDIYELDFFKLKYFKQLGRYYYLNKVLSFKKNRITKVELIEVRGFTPTELPVGSMVARLTSGSTVLANLTKYSGKLLKARLTGGSNMSATLTKYISVNLVAHLTSGSTMSAIMNKEVECCGIESVVAGTNVTIDVTDPKNPIINSDVVNYDVWVIAFSDETTAITAGVNKVEFQMPNYATTLTDVSCSFKTAPTTSAITIDLNEGGTSVLSTKLTVDANEKTSETAAITRVISDSSLAANAVITIDVDTADTGGTSAGGKLMLYFQKV